MRPEKICVGSGIELNYIYLDRFKTNSISIDFILPLTEKSAAANTLLPRVLRRGTKNKPTLKAITEYLDGMYGSILGSSCDKNGGNHICGFYAQTIRSKFANGENLDVKIIELIGEMLFNPYRENGKLCEKYIESEKKILCDKIDAIKNDKDKYAVKRTLEVLYEQKGKVIPSAGRVEDIKSLNADDLEEALQKLIKESKIVVYYTGTTDKQIIADSLKKLFGNIERQPYEIVEKKKFLYDGDTINTIEPMDVEQAKICIAYVSGIDIISEDYPAYRLLQAIIGTSPIAKLYMNVREKLSLCYYVYPAAIISNGVSVITAGIDGNDFEKTYSAIKKEYEDCQNGNITDDEMNAAKKSVCDSIITGEDRPLFIKNWYYDELFYGVRQSPEEFLEIIEKTTIDDIKRVVAKLKEAHVYLLKESDKTNE